jgi:hypothetical protein
MVKVLKTFANERQLQKLILGNFKIESAVDYTPKKGDPDYLKNSDVPWIKRFAAAGGKVIISGNTDMKYVPHERLALLQAGMIVFFFDGKWNQWKFFRKCSLLILWWPEISKKLQRAKPATFFHIPLSWNEKSKLRKVSTDDPRLLKIEKQFKAGDKVRRARKAAAEAKAKLPLQTSLLDLLGTHTSGRHGKNNKEKMFRKSDDPEQSKAFIEKAREIETDERRSAADDLVGRLAKMKPEPRVSGKK